MLSINRNIVECKEYDVRRIGEQIPVLIETLWNVKKIVIILKGGSKAVLIETLWNVKDLSSLFS